MKRKILLVGGSGYLGSCLEKTLESDFYVSITGTKSRVEMDYYQVDFLNPASYLSLTGKKFDLIFMLSASLTGLGKIDLENTDLTINTVKFASFLQFLSDEKLTEKLIYISSMTVYAPSLKLPVEENAPLNPLNVYGLSKKIAENIIEFFAQQQKVKTLVLRLPGIYGGNRKAGYIFNSILKAIKGEAIVIDTAGLGYWECIEINDLCNLILQLIDRFDWQNDFEVMNVGYGEKTDFIQTAETIVEELKSKSIIIVENKNGYSDFFMSNRRLLKYVVLESDFTSSLRKYSNNCKDEIYYR